MVDFTTSGGSRVVVRRCFMSPYLPRAKTHSTKSLLIATANEHHSVMMHLIVECGVDPVLNDDTQEAPGDNSRRRK